MFEYWVDGRRRGYVSRPTTEQLPVEVEKDLYARFEAACDRHHLDMESELVAFIARRTAELETQVPSVNLD
jgi:hypothetical protein